ncbi:helix-turn-helix domain-containing protein [Pseudomonas corrugata]
MKSKIIGLMAEGLTQAEVARRLGVSRSTVSKHLQKKNNA